jgi:hypothetical protein
VGSLRFVMGMLGLFGRGRSPAMLSTVMAPRRGDLAGKFWAVLEVARAAAAKLARFMNESLLAVSSSVRRSQRPRPDGARKANSISIARFCFAGRSDRRTRAVEPIAGPAKRCDALQSVHLVTQGDIVAQRKKPAPRRKAKAAKTQRKTKTPRQRKAASTKKASVVPRRKKAVSRKGAARTSRGRAAAKARSKPASGARAKPRRTARAPSAGRKSVPSRRRAVPKPEQARAQPSGAMSETLVVETVEEIAPGVVVIEETEIDVERRD